jgi:hypothetical protein
MLDSLSDKKPSYISLEIIEYTKRQRHVLLEIQIHGLGRAQTFYGVKPVYTMCTHNGFNTTQKKVYNTSKPCVR